jgi:hypothetical protein
MLAAQKVANLLTASNALQTQLGALAAAAGQPVPTVHSGQVVVTSATQDMGDKSMQLTYPRICLYASGLKNTRAEKALTLSGTVSVTGEVWASANLVQQADTWIHFYVEAFTLLLRQNAGDWGDGFFFSGVYEVAFQPPKTGGLGYVESAKVICALNVSQR